MSLTLNQKLEMIKVRKESMSKDKNRLKPRPLVPKSAKLGMKKKNSGRKLRVLLQ